jgi:carboxylate-amine ligase
VGRRTPGAITIGVEEEFFLVDNAGLLVQRAPETLDDTDDHGADVKPELLRCEVESAADVCATGSEVYRELTDLRTRLASGAARNGARLVATGTVVHQQPGDALISPGPRYHRIAEHFGQLVIGGLVCGCHVHVGVPDRAVVIQVINHLRPWLPMLLALLANSPFLNGRDTGYASSRHVIYSRWPCADPPPYLESLDHYEAIMAGLLETGAALDRKMVYWDVRPSEHQPTIEIRVPDIQRTVREATLIAILIRTLVAAALDLIDDGIAAPRVPTDVIRAGLWRAAKDGLYGRCPDPDTGRPQPVLGIADTLVSANAERLRAADDLDIVTSTMDWLRVGGADRQRNAYAARGSLGDVLDEVTHGIQNSPMSE